MDGLCHKGGPGVPVAALRGNERGEAYNSPIRMKRTTTSPPVRRSSRARWLIWVLAALVVAAGAAALWIRHEVAGSLPQVDGHVSVRGLARAAVVKRDRLGIPTIEAGDRTDAAWATGFVHGQDRFFAMDLSRRLAAGE